MRGKSGDASGAADGRGAQRRALKLWLAITVLLAVLPASAEKPKKTVVPLDEFVVGRHTFFDFGPPNDFYELYVVRNAGGITSVERITLTPAADACLNPAKAEVTIGAVPGTVTQLLQDKDLCSVSEKALKHERDRRKKQHVFSGANVTLEVSCDGNKRELRADLFDRDWFDQNAHTPDNSLWTMRLLDQLDKATGPSVMDKPAFGAAEEPPAPQRMSPAIADELAAGGFDGLFAGAPQKPSEIYRASQLPSAKPTVTVHVNREPTESQPIPYPPLAKAAHVEGVVAIHLTVESGGHPTIRFEGGHPMLRAVVEHAVNEWKFGPEDTGHEISGTVEFKLNCVAKEKR